MSPRYVVLDEERVNAKVCKVSDIKLIETVLKGLDDKKKRELKGSCLSHLCELPKSKYSAQLLQLVVCRIIKTCKLNEVLFMVNEKCFRFGLQEFALVTGLNCSDVPTGSEAEKVKNKHRIHDKYFKGINKILVADLEQKFLSCTIKNYKYKLGLALIIEGVLATKDKGAGISMETLSSVDDLPYFNSYPWGKISYHLLMKSLKRPWAKKADMVKLAAKERMSYMLYRFPMALQAWVYEAILELGSTFAKRIGDDLPRIIRWEGLGQTHLATYEEYIENNTVHVWATLSPSEDEQQKDYWTSMKPPSDVEDDVFDKFVSDTMEIQEAIPLMPPQFVGENRDPKRRKKYGKAPSQQCGQNEEETGDNDTGRGKSTHACSFDVSVIRELLDSHTRKIEKKIDDIKGELNHQLDIIEDKLKYNATLPRVDYHFDVSAMRDRVNQFSSVRLEMGDKGATFSPSFVMDDNVGDAQCNMVVQAENETVSEEQEIEQLVPRRRSKRQKNPGPNIRTPYTPPHPKKK